jgi:hypothetical protein
MAVVWLSSAGNRNKINKHQPIYACSILYVSRVVDYCSIINLHRLQDIASIQKYQIRLLFPLLPELIPRFAPACIPTHTSLFRI